MERNHEVWKVVPSPELGGEYEVSNLGRVRRVSDGRILSVAKLPGGKSHPNGYAQVHMYRNDGRQVCRSVARMCMRAFGRAPEDGECRVGHYDGDPLNCRITNLYWVAPVNKKHDVARVRDWIASTKDLAIELKRSAADIANRFDYYRESETVREQLRVLDRIYSLLEQVVNI